MAHEAADESSHHLDAGSPSTKCRGDDAEKDFEMTIEDPSQQPSKKYVMVFVWHNSKTSILISEHCPCSFKLGAAIFLGILVLSCIIGISMWQVNTTTYYNYHLFSSR